MTKSKFNITKTSKTASSATFATSSTNSSSQISRWAETHEKKIKWSSTLLASFFIIISLIIFGIAIVRVSCCGIDSATMDENDTQYQHSNKQQVYALPSTVQWNTYPDKCEALCFQINVSDISQIIADKLMQISDCANKIELDFSNCKYDNQTLDENWLTLSNIVIKKLHINGGNLKIIKDNTFNNKNFNNMDSLVIGGLSDFPLTRGIFNGLTALTGLSLHVEKTTLIENGLFYALTALETLDFKIGGQELTSDDIRSILNSSTLSTLKSFQTEGCKLGDSLNNESFTGLTSIVSLFLHNSGIRSIGRDTFSSLHKTLQLLHLNLNGLKTLPNGIFNNLIPTNLQYSTFRVVLGNNPWHCDCKLLELQTLIRTERNHFSDSVICTNFDENAIEIVNLGECNETVTETIPTTDTVNTQSTSVNTTQQTIPTTSEEVTFPADDTTKQVNITSSSSTEGITNTTESDSTEGTTTTIELETTTTILSTEIITIESETTLDTITTSATKSETTISSTEITTTTTESETSSEATTLTNDACSKFRRIKSFKMRTTKARTSTGSDELQNEFTEMTCNLMKYFSVNRQDTAKSESMNSSSNREYISIPIQFSHHGLEIIDFLDDSKYNEIEIRINENSTFSKLLLVWFTIEHNIINNTRNVYRLNDEITCKNIESSSTSVNVTSNFVYLFCIVERDTDNQSLDCLPYGVRSNPYETPKIPSIIYVLIASILIAITLGFISGICIVVKKPHWLWLCNRRNRRVKRKSNNSITVQSNESVNRSASVEPVAASNLQRNCSQRRAQVLQLTRRQAPIRRSISETSIESSSRSYVSAISPNNQYETMRSNQPRINTNQSRTVVIHHPALVHVPNERCPTPPPRRPAKPITTYRSHICHTSNQCCCRHHMCNSSEA